MRASLWLAWRELSARKSAFATGLFMVAVSMALCVGTTLLSRMREVAVGAQIDHIGPPIRIIPASNTAYDLAQFNLDQESLPIGLAEVRHMLSPWIRALDARLLSRVLLDGVSRPAIGVDPSRVISPLEPLRRLGKSEVALGSHLAATVGGKVGSEISIRERRFRIVAILPETASSEDLAVFLPLEQLQALLNRPGTINEIRIYPASGDSFDRILSRLESDSHAYTIINAHRGETAENQIGNRLTLHSAAVYAITALVVALSIFIWSYLNADERKLEMATIVAIGGSNMTIVWLVITRAALVGFVGGFIGYVIGAAAALAQDIAWGLRVALSWDLALTVLSSTVALSAFGALAASFLFAFRRHAEILQES